MSRKGAAENEKKERKVQVEEEETVTEEEDGVRRDPDTGLELVGG